MFLGRWSFNDIGFWITLNAFLEISLLVSHLFKITWKLVTWARRTRALKSLTNMRRRLWRVCNSRPTKNMNKLHCKHIFYWWAKRKQTCFFKTSEVIFGLITSFNLLCQSGQFFLFFLDACLKSRIFALNYFRLITLINSFGLPLTDRFQMIFQYSFLLNCQFVFAFDQFHP